MYCVVIISRNRKYNQYIIDRYIILSLCIYKYIYIIMYWYIGLLSDRCMGCGVFVCERVRNEEYQQYNQQCLQTVGSLSDGGHGRVSITCNVHYSYKRYPVSFKRTVKQQSLIGFLSSCQRALKSQNVEKERMQNKRNKAKQNVDEKRELMKDRKNS